MQFLQTSRARINKFAIKSAVFKANNFNKNVLISYENIIFTNFGELFEDAFAHFKSAML